MAEYKDNRKLNFLLRHPEYHNTYKNSPFPYQIYKIEAFNNEEEKGKKLLQFIVDRPSRIAGNPLPPLKVRVSSSGGPCQ